MTATRTIAELERRRQVRVRLRRNLAIHRQEGAAQTYYVLKDPISLNYFRLEEGQRFVVGLMDGKHTLSQIQREFEKRFRPERLSLEELEVFAQQLIEGGLALSDSRNAGKLLAERAVRQESRAFWAKILNIFYIKIPLLNPNKMLERFDAIGRTFFSVGFFSLCLVLMAGAIALLFSHWQEFITRLPSYQEFFSLQSLFYIWLTFGVVKIVHELGHALCCKAMGGDVHEMGVLFLFFFPSLYCDVSDSWTLPSKWKRMAIGAAGVYVEMLLAALATFTWWWTEPSSTINYFAFSVMLVCSINSLVCNVNPLMRFDGYFVLADWLEVPNLSQQSMQCLKTACMRWLGMDVPADHPPGRVGPRLLALFALASLVYRWVFLVVALWLFYQFAQVHNLGSASMVVIVFGIAVLLLAPMHRLTKSLLKRGSFPEMKISRLVWTFGIVAGAAAVFFAVPFSQKVRGLALIQADPDQVRRIEIPETGGFLETVHVLDGQSVKKGDILAVLSNPHLEIKLRLNEAEQALKRQQQNTQIAQLSDQQTAEDQGFETVQSEVELQTLLHQHATLREQKARLILRAPANGVIMGLVRFEEKGRWLERGAELCRIANPDALRAVVMVEPADYKLIARGNPAAIRIHGSINKQGRGIVTSLSQVEAKDIPPQLSSRAGGDVFTQHDPVSKKDTPRSQHYLVTLHLQQIEGSVHPGVLGRVKIEAGAHTLWSRAQRFLASTVNWGL